MNRTITIYGKQEAITYITDQGVIMVHETESHKKNHIAITLADILNTPVKELTLTIKNHHGTVTYNNGCRELKFNLAFIQK